MTTKGCTVKELREFLAKLPDDLAVKVLAEHSYRYETSTRWIELCLPTDEHHLSSDEVYVGDKTLELGSK